MEIEEIQKEINLIKERNKKVEGDKAWETSKTRIASIIIMTYLVTSVAFYFLGVKNYLSNALIPTLGFYLSTQSLPFIKKWWLNRIHKK